MRTSAGSWAVIGAAAGGVVLLGVAGHEWIYHEQHKYASGPSEVLAIGFLAAAVVAFSVAVLAYEVAVHEHTHSRKGLSLKDWPPGDEDG